MWGSAGSVAIFLHGNAASRLHSFPEKSSPRSQILTLSQLQPLSPKKLAIMRAGLLNSSRSAVRVSYISISPCSHQLTSEIEFDSRSLPQTSIHPHSCNGHHQILRLLQTRYWIANTSIFQTYPETGRSTTGIRRVKKTHLGGENLVFASGQARRVTPFKYGQWTQHQR